MGSPSRRLTDLAIQNLKPRASRYEVPDPGARGLYLIVQPSGKKSFAVRYRHNGQPRKLTLQAGVSLSAARKLCADALHEVAQGHDPSEARQTAKMKAAAAKLNTVANVCEEYFKREHGKLRTAKTREVTLRRLVFPTFGSRQIDTIKRSEIVRLIDRIEDNNGPRIADLSLRYLSRIMSWHALRDDNFRTPILRGMGRWNHAEHARERVLTDDELRKLWVASDAVGYFGALIRFLLLTGARRGEAGEMTWSEIRDGVWHLPAARNKAGVDFARPLSKAALDIIEKQPQLGDYIFTFNGKRPISFGKTKSELAKRVSIADWRLHDLRRTSRTLLSRAGVDPDIAERCLGHSRGTIRAIYDRHSFEPEMRIAFEKLSALIDRIINPPAGVVTPIRGRG